MQGCFRRATNPQNKQLLNFNFCQTQIQIMFVPLHCDRMLVYSIEFLSILLLLANV
uniref:Uncharacterized protein n=1 Tax=Arundo donax TaxID=35708 RepID=A0A0A8Z9Y6_ARUDO